MARQDQANDQLFAHLVPLWRQRRLYRGALRPLRGGPAIGRSRMARLLRGARRTTPATSARTPRAPPGKTRNWPLPANGELVSALDGNWRPGREGTSKEDQGQGRGQRRRACPTPTSCSATRDSVRAIMMIRAYRMRGHLHANLDPLGLAKPLEDYNELSPEAYGFTEADYDRTIFIDNVLGLEYATIRADARDPRRAPIARRSASSSCTSPIPRRRPGSRSASKGRTRGSPSRRRASRRS